MSDLYSRSTLTAITIIVIYGLITIYRSYLKSKNSIKDGERIHRYILIVSGILIGLGINTLDEDFSGVRLIENQNMFFGILIALSGVVGVAFAKYYLQNIIYKPLEQISEFAAEYGTDFVGTRLPVTGVIELQSFSQRFNNNALALAHQLSETEIQLDKLKRDVNQQIDNFNVLSEDMGQMNHLFGRSAKIIDTYSENLTSLQGSTRDFISWYEKSEEDLNELLLELKSLTDLGNLIAVNAAIESINMEIENPGFTTIAEKLHDLSKTLEDRHGSLQKFLLDMKNQYSNFSTKINRVMMESSELIDESSKISINLESLLNSFNNFDSTMFSKNDKIRVSVSNIIASLPNTF